MIWGRACPALAQDGHLTDRGRTLIGGSIAASFSNDTKHPGLYRYATWAYWIRPSVICFVKNGVGLGAFVDYASARHDLDLEVRREHAVAGGLQALWELRLADQLGLQLHGLFGYGRMWSRSTLLPDGLSTNDNAPGATAQPRLPRRRRRWLDKHQIRGGLLVPLVFHLSPSVGVGFGPEVYVRATYAVEPIFERKHARRWEIGASSWIGVAL